MGGGNEYVAPLIVEVVGNDAKRLGWMDNSFRPNYLSLLSV